MVKEEVTKASKIAVFCLSFTAFLPVGLALGFGISDNNIVLGIVFMLFISLFAAYTLLELYQKLLISQRLKLNKYMIISISWILISFFIIISMSESRQIVYGSFLHTIKEMLGSEPS